MDTQTPQANPAPANWRKQHALGLPSGSVRALLALIVFGVIWYLLWRSPAAEVPGYLRDLMFIIMGHYFAVRHQSNQPGSGPPPLFLPKGSVRSLLLLGFVTIGVLIYRRDGFHINEAWLTLLLVGGFMLGVLVGILSGKRRWPRILEDIRAVVSLVAGVVLVVLVLKLWSPSDGVTSFTQYTGKYRLEDILAAVVGFYFGSKS